MFATLEDIEAGLQAITADLDPDTFHGSDAQAAMERFARIERIAHAGARLMAKRVADTGIWKNHGHQSAAHAVAKALGCSVGEAHRILGTADKLAKGLDATDQAARRGDLSSSQAGHVADAAAVDPAAESDLLDLAGSASTAELRDESRRRRHAAARDDAERHRRIRRNRALRMWSDDDGGARLSWSHLPELGAEVAAILDPYIDDQFHTARREGRREHRDAYAADAFVDALRDAAAYRRGESLDDEPDAERDSVDEDTATVPVPVPVPVPDDDDRRPDDAGPFDDTVDAPTADNRTSDRPAAANQRGDADGPSSSEPGTDTDSAMDAARGDDRRDHDPADERTVASDDNDNDDFGDERATATSTDAATGTRDGAPGGRPPDAEPGAPPGPGSRTRAGRRRRKRKNRRRGADAKVIVRIDHTALLRGHTEAGEVCEIAGLGPVPVASVRALLDDAFLAAVILKGNAVVNVAHLGRSANAYQLTGLQAQPKACTTLGCPNSARLEHDHRNPYCDTHQTILDELDPSCPHCHDLKTYEGYRHTPGTGKRPLLSPAQQADWNRQHPDNLIAPLDPPGRRGPNPRSTASATTTTPTPRNHAEPRPEALTLDL